MIHTITVHINIQYIILYYITLHYITLHYITLHYIILYYIILYYIILYYIILYYIMLCYSCYGVQAEQGVSGDHRRQALAAAAKDAKLSHLRRTIQSLEAKLIHAMQTHADRCTPVPSPTPLKTAICLFLPCIGLTREELAVVSMMSLYQPQFWPNPYAIDQGRLSS